MDEKQRRGRYTPEFRQEAGRQVKAGRSDAAVAQALGIPKASLTNWVRADKRGEPLKGINEPTRAAPVVTPEQAEIAQLRAEVARLRMERDIAEKPRRTLRRTCCKVRVDSSDEGVPADRGDVPGAGGEHQRVFQFARGCQQACGGRQAVPQRRGLGRSHQGCPCRATGEYGWPRMQKELRNRGLRVGKERVRQLMQRHGIRAKGKRRFVVTTDSRHRVLVAPDLVQWRFTPSTPNSIWTGDITLYLAAVAIRYRHTRRGQYGYYVRRRAWDVDVAPRLTVAPYRDRTVAEARQSAVSLH